MAKWGDRYRYHPPAAKSLAEVEQDLWDWGICEIMWACAKSRGMPKGEFVPSYHDFIESNYRKRNYLGELVLGTKERARCHGWLWLRDHTDYPSLKHRLKTDPEWQDAEWQDAGAKNKTGKNLGWRVFTNVVTR